MGIYDREYYQEEGGTGPFNFGKIAAWPWTYKLIGILTILFFLDHLLPTGAGGAPLGAAIGPLTEWGSYSTTQALERIQIWRLFTYPFVNPDVRSWLFSLLILYFFGRTVEAALGTVKFLVFFMICAVGGALISSVVVPALYQTEAFLFGAWPSVIGLIIATGVLKPHQTVLFMFVLPLTMQTLAILTIVIDVAYAVSGFQQGVHHLAGALVGYTLIKNLSLLGFVDQLGSTTRRGGPVTIPFKNVTKVFEAKPVSEVELDRLLDKVHAEGIDSLTASEKATLKRASKQRRNRSF